MNDHVNAHTFNRRAAFFGALTAFLAVEAAMFAGGKTCDNHFNFGLMAGWLVVTNFFAWFFWIPLTLVIAALFGFLIVSDAEKTYRVLAWIMVAVPIAVFVLAFIATPYGSAGTCVV